MKTIANKPYPDKDKNFENIKKQKYIKPEIKEMELHSLDPTNDIACIALGSGSASSSSSGTSM
jgi:hypothetical protein